MGQISKRVADRQWHSLFLASLPNSRADPRKNNIIDTKAETDKEVNAKHPSGKIECRYSDDEAHHDDGLTDGDVERALVPPPRSPGHGDTYDRGEEIRWTC